MRQASTSLLLHTSRPVDPRVSSSTPPEMAVVLRVAERMLQEAKDAEDAAKQAQAEAEKRSRAAHYVSTQSDAYPIGSGDGDLVVKLCEKLAITTEAVRELTHLLA